jgi:hypothetical protein
MADVRAIHDIILVHSHHPLLLVSYLFFCKIGTVFAFISRHFIILAISLRRHIRLRDVSIAIVLHHASIFSIIFLATILAETVGLALAAVLLVRSVAEALGA